MGKLPSSHSKEKSGKIMLIYNLYVYENNNKNIWNSVSVRFNDNRVWRRLKEQLAG
jgi:hypothetical protein